MQSEHMLRAHTHRHTHSSLLCKNQIFSEIKIRYQSSLFSLRISSGFGLSRERRGVDVAGAGAFPVLGRVLIRDFLESSLLGTKCKGGV